MSNETSKTYTSKISTQAFRLISIKPKHKYDLYIKPERSPRLHFSIKPLIPRISSINHHLRNIEIKSISSKFKKQINMQEPEIHYKNYKNLHLRHLRLHRLTDSLAVASMASTSLLLRLSSVGGHLVKSV
jgi:hypothetical protein